MAILAARDWRKRNPKLWWSLTILAVMSLVLMLPVTSLAYRLMPDLRFVQFPWRWLLVLGVSYAVFIVIAAATVSRKVVGLCIALRGIDRRLQSGAASPL